MTPRDKSLGEFIADYFVSVSAQLASLADLLGQILAELQKGNAKK